MARGCRVLLIVALAPFIVRLAPPVAAANVQTLPRRMNSITMDVDFTEQAAGGGADAINIVGTIQLILDRIAARTAPDNKFGQPRSILWLPVTAQRECQDGTDAGILEVRVARFLGYNHQWIIYGRQHEEADLSFRLLDCSGRQILAFPSDGSSYASASFSPYYVSVGGTAAAIALASSHSDNVTIAASIGVVNAYGPLQANVGAHDPMEMQELALYRLMGNIPGSHVPPPAPGTVADLLDRCWFGTAEQHFAFACPPQQQ
jgi:hypothetical protein